LAAAAAAACVVLAGCGSSAGHATPAARSTPPAQEKTPQTFSIQSPSVSARMTCSEEEVQNAITLSLGLTGHPPKSSEWVKPVYYCTYQLHEGPLRLTVTEFVSDAAALHELNELKSQYAQDKTPIQTLENFDVPAFLISDDLVITVKDNKLLRVDATQLPKIVGPLHRTRRDLSYLVASAILRCWSGD
jgi:hypothetical protein